MPYSPLNINTKKQKEENISNVYALTHMLKKKKKKPFQINDVYGFK